MDDSHKQACIWRIDKPVDCRLTSVCLLMQVQEAVKLGRQLVEDSICPWAIVSVWGFTGQPVSWMGSPPNSASSERGQNDYSIVILSGGRYVLLVASGDGDAFQTV